MKQERKNKDDELPFPYPRLDAQLLSQIRAEFSQQVKLSGQNPLQLPSIGTIALNFAYR
jgi:hypothetical protein